VTVTFSDAAHVEKAVRSVREPEEEDDVRSRLGHRVAVSADDPNVFLSAAPEDAAREADRAMRQVLAKHQLTAEFALDRWHPLEEDWVDASVPLPEPPSSWQTSTSVAWRTRTESPSRPGQAGYEARVELRSHRQARTSPPKAA
jgi:hypothetical protein